MMSVTGDMTFGQSGANFLVNSAGAVAQLVLTRLRLWTAQWYLDLTDGTPWSTQVLGTGTASLYNAAIRNRILATPGVTGIPSYSATVDPTTRVLTLANTTIQTQFSPNPIPLPANFTFTVPG
jgi:hypothetical protein